MSNDLRNLFKPANFNNLIADRSYPQVQEDAAKLAQYFLNKALDQAVRVYGTNNGTWNVEDCSDDTLNPDTHQALLVQIEELPKKECAHEARGNGHWSNPWTNKCKHCGVKLVARWEKA